jgi:long-subunit acyl-CoA synthetase (AMP-forming)
MLQGIFDALGGEENTRKLIAENSPIIHKIREGFGGRIKWMLSGSAPINPKVIELLGKIMGVPFS